MYQLDSWDDKQRKYVIVIETSSYCKVFDAFASLCKKEEKSEKAQAVRMLIKEPKEVIYFWTNRPNEFNYDWMLRQ